MRSGIWLGGVNKMNNGIVNQREKKLKVLFWRTEFYGAVTEGGTASLHNGKIRGFHKLGHKVAYASSGPMILEDGVNYHYIPYSKLFRNLPEVLNMPYMSKSVREFKKIIKIEKPDFIYQHHHDFHYGGSVIKRDLGIPFILHIDGIAYWTKGNWGKLYNKKLLKWAEEIQVHNADAIVVPSQNLKNQIVEWFNVNPDKIYPAPNGVDPDLFTPEVDGGEFRAKYGIEDKFVVGFTGTFGDWHGLETLAESIKYVIEEIPEAVFFFVGDGNLRPNIERIIKRDKVEKHAIITGFVPYKDIPKYLAASDVLLSPCVNNADSPFFNSPVKLFEYMAMEKPIVVTKVGQQNDIFEHGVNGLMCEEKQPKELAEQIIESYKNKELSQKIAKQAREDAIEKYDWSVNSQIIIDAYYDIINKKI